MKTAMIELIDELSKLYNMDYGGAKDGLRIAIDTAMNQLKSIEKEKQQIINAWDHGYENCDNDWRSGATAEKYFDQSFNPTK
jgi:uncharacterized protein YggL (DUF469 family)